MFKSEEVLLDFKAEEKKTYSSVFDIEDLDSDSGTMSANETNSYDCSTPTPPLFCKLRKARVMIKKLPQHVLDKYNINKKKTKQSPTTEPSRASKRIGGKTIPGIYLSLHVNKPLSVVLNPKKRKRTVTTNKQINSQVKKSLRLSQKSLRRSKSKLRSAVTYRKQKPTYVKTSTAVNLSTAENPSCARTSLHDKLSTKRGINQDKHLKNSLTNAPPIRFATHSSLTNGRTLHERIAATRLINKDFHFNKKEVSRLPNCPDVVITKYDLPPKNLPEISQNASTSLGYNQSVNICPQITPIPLSNLYNNNFGMISRPQPNITVHVPKSFGPTFSNFSYTPSTQSNIVFPAQIMTSSHFQAPNQPIVINAAAIDSSADFFSGVHQPNKESVAKQTTTTASSFTITPDNITENYGSHVETKRIGTHGTTNKDDQPSNDETRRTATAATENNPVILNSPKVLIIKQPPLTCDPLQVAQQVDRADSDIETYVESASDLELSDTETRKYPEVIKRVIYHTKSVQTKFTCNGAICGLVDSDKFNLNCFYCYEIFPLHKWQVFKEHIKIVHHVEEQENEEDSEDTENVQTQDCPATKTSTQNANTLDSNKTLISKEKAQTKEHCEPQQVQKKLPLEHRLVTQRLFRMATEQIKSSTPKTPALPTKQLNQTQESNTKSKKDSLVNYLNNSSTFDEIISLGSDGEDDIVGIEDDDENVQQVKETSKNMPNNAAAPINDVEKLLTSTLPHLTIKKILPKPVPMPTSSRSLLKEPFIKIPSNYDIHRVIKTIPKPKTPQVTANGSTRPRYFVVKKIIKPATTGTKPNVNISKGMILTKMSKSNKCRGNDVDDMPSNDENENAVPKPTNGCGILFGLTNPMVVIEFLLKLKTFPDLWRPQLTKDSSVDIDESVRKLCQHLNNRFDIDIKDFEIRLSIQRVKVWYRRMLTNLHEHNKNPNNTQPYQHKFPLYFKILNQYLKPNVHYTNIKKTGAKSSLNPNVSNSVEKDEKKGDESKPASAETAPDTSNTDNLIEFDGDTLYENESSEEEILEKFNESNGLKPPPEKKRTKIYRGNFECDMCHKSFKRMCDLKRHRVHHFPPEFECGVCSQKFYFKHWALKCNHLKKQNYKLGVKKYIKQDKGTTIVTPKRIWPKKIHKFKLICEICGSSYRQIGSLNSHKRDKHFNQRLKCIVCNFTALTNYRIVMHQKKHHIVEPGTVEEVAKKSRPRTETKTRFSTQARQEFDWRREMRKKLKPGEKFYACCKCRIIFNSRKEKVLHNKIEHPIKETTVACLLCLPSKFLLSNSNSARRHYTDIHKVPWDEIDALVKRTKPIYNVLSKEEIELLNASENYKELLEQFLKDRNLEPIEKVMDKEEPKKDEALEAVQNLPHISKLEEKEEEQKLDLEYTQEEGNVFVDGIIDHDYNMEADGQVLIGPDEYLNSNEHSYSEYQTPNENCDSYIEANHESNNHDGVIQLAYDNEGNDSAVRHQHQQVQDDQEYIQSMVDHLVEGDLVDGELVEECIVVEECVDDVIDEQEDYF